MARSLVGRGVTFRPDRNSAFVRGEVMDKIRYGESARTVYIIADRDGRLYMVDPDKIESLVIKPSMLQ